MAYERNEYPGGRPYQGGRDYGRDDYGRQERNRGEYGGRGSYAQREDRQFRGEQGYRSEQNHRSGRDDDRGFFERAGEEVRSWFGDDDRDQGRYSRNSDRYDARANNRSFGGDRGRDEHGGGMIERAFANTGSFFMGDDDDRGMRGQEFEGPSRSMGGSFQGGSAPRGGSAGQQFSGHPHDHGYHNWRQRQIEALDRDYEDYRREHQQQFDTHFSGWRDQRQQLRQSMSGVQEHAEVVGSDGQHVGTVDKVRGDQIILTKNDRDAGGRHHSIPLSWLTSCEASKVTLNKTAEEAKRLWQDAERDEQRVGQQRDGFGQQQGGDTSRGALFGNEQPNNGGPHMLNRSFSGTY